MPTGQGPLTTRTPAVGPAQQPGIFPYQEGQIAPQVLPTTQPDLWNHQHIFLGDPSIPNQQLKWSSPATRLRFTLGAARIFVKFGLVSVPPSGLEAWCDLVLPAVAENPATAGPFAEFVVPQIQAITFGMGAAVNDDYHVWALAGSFDRP